jgi:hypothetical protein
MRWGGVVDDKRFLAGTLSSFIDLVDIRRARIVRRRQLGIRSSSSRPRHEDESLAICRDSSMITSPQGGPKDVNHLYSLDLRRWD